MEDLNWIAIVDFAFKYAVVLTCLLSTGGVLLSHMNLGMKASLQKSLSKKLIMAAFFVALLASVVVSVATILRASL